MPSPTLRIARPTNDLTTLRNFYTGALGLEILSSFTNNAGFDGVMLGHPSYTGHHEFTYQHGVTVVKALSKEPLLVFHIEDKEEWEAAVRKVEEGGRVRVESENPYWEVKGVTFEDPEGWRVVLQNEGRP